MDPPSPRQSVRAPGGAQYGDATTEARMDGSAMSYLEQPWEATEGKGGELVDIREFRRKWQAVLRPPSPRVDHLDYILLQHQYPRQRSLPPSADIALRVLGDEDTENLVPPPDLSCDDIFIGTARQQIQAAIEREMEKEENQELLAKGLSTGGGAAALMLRAEVPLASDIAKQKAEAHAFLSSLREKEEAAKQVQKGKKRIDVNYLTPNMNPGNLPFEEIDHDEVIISVAIYHHKKQLKIHEFLVLGGQKLTLLRDKITCVSDQIAVPKSEAGYFFFENVFYDDLRNGRMRYSTEVIEWAKKRARSAGAESTPYRAKSMEDTVWADLKVRTGVPYLYCHRGNCEHRIVINEIRLVTKYDTKNKNEYPLHIFQSKIRRRKCTICDIYPAKHLTYNDELSPQNPCFYCDRCYQPFHYGFDGNILRTNFQRYPYYHE